jgi:hypothetical protein
LISETNLRLPRNFDVGIKYKICQITACNLPKTVAATFIVRSMDPRRHETPDYEKKCNWYCLERYSFRPGYVSGVPVWTPKIRTSKIASLRFPGGEGGDTVDFLGINQGRNCFLGGWRSTAEAGAEVAPEAGAPEAGASEAGADASEPPSEPLADEQYEAGGDVMDDVDEIEEGKVLSKRDYGDNSPSQKRPFVAKGVWVWIRRLKKHPALIATNPTQRRTHVCTRPDCWRLINMGYDKGQKCWQTTKSIAHDKRYHAEESKAACALAQCREVKERLKVNVMLSSYAGPAQIVVCKRDAALAGLARCYTYGRGRISKETFDDQAHRDRDQRMFEAGGGKGKAQFLTKKNLVEWVR